MRPDCLDEVSDPPLYYDQEGQPCSCRRWAELFKDRFLHDDHNVGKKHARVATIYVGLNDLTPPLRIYETMVFVEGREAETHAWPSKDAAISGHTVVLAKWLNQ